METSREKDERKRFFYLFFFPLMFPSDFSFFPSSLTSSFFLRFFPSIFIGPQKSILVRSCSFFHLQGDIVCSTCVCMSFYLVLSCLYLIFIFSCVVVCCRVLSCLVVSHPVLSGLVLSCLVLSGRVWSVLPFYLVVFCLILSYVVLCCLVLSSLV